MEKFNKLTSKAIPLAISNVDTDLIIPAQFLTSVSREGYGQNVFKRIREEDPNFPLNLEKFKGGEILVVKDNFGCGSSREHAVWALMGAGIKTIIGTSFADIFSGNSAKNGLLLIEQSPQLIEKLLEDAKDGNLKITIDLENQSLETSNGDKSTFDYDEFRKHCLLNGLDDIDYILSNKSDIERYRSEKEEYRFYSTTKANH